MLLLSCIFFKPVALKCICMYNCNFFTCTEIYIITYKRYTSNHLQNAMPQ